ncbi:MAG: hypothetical protein NTV97_12565 [Alphaproteobacteria bacterium]|nr:hypothetical protein [Alphaproteobacteria bacterium]
MAENRQTEIDRNLAFFLRELPELMSRHAGKYALLRHEEVTGYYDTVADAVAAGNSLYPDQLFSVQQVSDAASNLGHYSYAVSLGNP